MSEVDEALIEVDRLLAGCHTALEEWHRKISEANGPLLPGRTGDDVEIALQDVLAAIFTARDVVDSHISWTGD